MSSREKILGAIENINLDSKPMPVIPIYDGLGKDKHAFFIEMLHSLGVQVIVSDDISQLHQIADEFRTNGPVYSAIDAIPSDLTEGVKKSSLECAIIQGDLGVAENGAIWVEGDQLQHRSLTAIATNLVIVMPFKKVVWNMHEAYTYVRPQENGYGVFISGPSKTADIEQSLVKGAHGAKSLTVFIQK
ncbi:lactate utilization protein [Flammeovirga yaeyamensis]|uniref:Lactate utilization protein n=1 Tax=Flammeovirga yaeyamensis TaxID=367791 RepID=A0AAX1N9F7_9BACT|nr:LUD domain-containing protein [Flammeovirga yaeyamensis]MBB3699539.1 L-lactate dehydrogenase complex protein LldG [Flammeovirga yaeyamensis]NMF35206.1 LUD domain-containing protein [Flammeovirga yaeyamensis]QWG04069.1 lactate utilization protein [Flammeovirga yaeyamensis]